MVTPRWRPCPFCGGNPNVIFQLGGSVVRCPRCDIQAPEAVWNSRPVESDLQATLEASATGHGVWPV